MLMFLVCANLFSIGAFLACFSFQITIHPVFFTAHPINLFSIITFMYIAFR